MIQEIKFVRKLESSSRIAVANAFQGPLWMKINWHTLRNCSMMSSETALSTCLLNKKQNEKFRKNLLLEFATEDHQQSPYYRVYLFEFGLLIRKRNEQWQSP